MAPPSSLLPPGLLGATRAAFARFTAAAVREMLGPVGRAAHERGDLGGVGRSLPRGERLSTLVRLFLLGEPVDERDARSALEPLEPNLLPLLEGTAGSVRARVEVRPYDEADGAGPWWVVSDFGADARPGPLAPDHVLGIGAASLTLAQAVAREPVARALDLGTGSGVQALHLSTHAGAVTATDISARALRMAATTAALSGVSWDLRQGSLLDPVQSQLFDLVVANPPFVVSPGWRSGSGGYDYRDSGLTGDGVSAALLRGVPALLAPGGSASLLANWIIDSTGEWEARLHGWLAGTGCDAWVWQREVADPGSYVSLWLRDAGEVPGSARWAQRYDAWLDWFEQAGVAAVGMGLVTLWRTDVGQPVVVCEDVPQAVEQPAGTHISGWVTRQRWLSSHDDDALLAARLRCAADVVRVRHDTVGTDGWDTQLWQLRLSHAMRWEIEADDAVTGLVAACNATLTLETLLGVLAVALGREVQQISAALLPVVRDLIARGFLDVARLDESSP